MSSFFFEKGKKYADRDNDIFVYIGDGKGKWIIFRGRPASESLTELGEPFTVGTNSDYRRDLRIRQLTPLEELL